MLQTSLIVILLIVDAGLIFAFWQFMRRRTIEADVVAELADELLYERQSQLPEQVQDPEFLALLPYAVK